jgi:hypothetical protein
MDFGFMSHRLQVFSLIVIMLFLSGCQFLASQEETAFQALYPDIEMNTDINLTSTNVAHEFPGSFFVVISNESKKDIWFPDHYNVEIYTLDSQNGTWVKVTNKIQYPAGTEHLVPPYKPNSLKSTRWFPIWPDVPSNTSIRVVVIGQVHRNGDVTNEKMGAYTDIELK